MLGWYYHDEMGQLMSSGTFTPLPDIDPPDPGPTTTTTTTTTTTPAPTPELNSAPSGIAITVEDGA